MTQPHLYGRKFPQWGDTKSFEQNKIYFHVKIAGDDLADNLDWNPIQINTMQV